MHSELFSQTNPEDHILEFGIRDTLEDFRLGLKVSTMGKLNKVTKELKLVSETLPGKPMYSMTRFSDKSNAPTDAKTLIEMMNKQLDYLDAIWVEFKAIIKEGKDVLGRIDEDYERNFNVDDYFKKSSRLFKDFAHWELKEKEFPIVQFGDWGKRKVYRLGKNQIKLEKPKSFDNNAEYHEWVKVQTRGHKLLTELVKEGNVLAGEFYMLAIKVGVKKAKYGVVADDYFVAMVNPFGQVREWGIRQLTAFGEIAVKHHK